MTGEYEGTALGTITICQDCGFAIQLRRERFKSLSGEYDVWMHFRPSITPHVGIPMRSVEEVFYNERGRLI